MNTPFSFVICIVVFCCRLVSADEEFDPAGITVVLAGDSTVTDAAGWGRGFAKLLNDGAHCVNLARGGQSSRSYRSAGWWQKCLDAKPDYLLIQFGHNDQPGKGVNRESAADGAFQDHLRQFVDEALAINCKPVLITSLTRRRWNTDHQIEPTLQEYADATSIVAKEKNVPLLDLHRLSIKQCNAYGPEAFRAFEPMTPRGADHSHLNTTGAQEVGRIVAQELLQILPEFAALIDADAVKPSVPRQTILRNPSNGLHLAETEATISVSVNKRAIITYNKQSPPVPSGISNTYRRSGFLHPIASPTGHVVTATFPYDHPHQHGVFSAWVRTRWNEREIDFWNLAGGTGQVLHQRVISTFSDATSTGFEVDLVHRATQPPAVDVLRERWRIDVIPTDDTFHCFDVETTQYAQTDIPLFVQEYHYGGIALRGPTRWLQGAVKETNPGEPEIREASGFTNNRGSDRARGNHQKARWVALTGMIDNKPVSIAVLCHTDNFRSPQTARLHPTKPYFCFAPCVDAEFVIDKAHPLHGRYRYLVTDNPPNVEWLNKQWQSWCEGVEE